MKYYLRGCFFSVIVSLIMLFIDYVYAANHQAVSAFVIFTSVFIGNLVIWILLKLTTLVILTISVLFLRKVSDLSITLLFSFIVFIISVLVWWVVGSLSFAYHFSKMYVVFSGLSNIFFFYLFILDNHQALLQGF